MMEAATMLWNRIRASRLRGHDDWAYLGEEMEREHVESAAHGDRFREYRTVVFMNVHTGEERAIRVTRNKEMWEV